MNDRRGVSLGIALVAVGLYALLWRELDVRGPGPLLLLLGAAFLAISALRRFRGPLLAGAVLAGLGAGLLLRDSFEPRLPGWATILLGLGAGFLLVAAIDGASSRSRQPSPLVPGVALTGIALAAGIQRALPLVPLWSRLETLWPIALLAVGLVLIATALRRRRA
jgi:hypothetical protein